MIGCNVGATRGQYVFWGQVILHEKILILLFKQSHSVQGKCAVSL